MKMKMAALIEYKYKYLNLCVAILCLFLGSGPCSLVTVSAFKLTSFSNSNHNHNPRYSYSYNNGKHRVISEKYCRIISTRKEARGQGQGQALNAVSSVIEGLDVLRKSSTDKSKSVTDVFSAISYIESCDYDSGLLVGGKGTDTDSAPFSELYGTWKLLYSVEGKEGVEGVKEDKLSTPLVPECRDIGVTRDLQRAQITRYSTIGVFSLGFKKAAGVFNKRVSEYRYSKEESAFEFVKGAALDTKAASKEFVRLVSPSNRKTGNSGNSDRFLVTSSSPRGQALVDMEMWAFVPQ